MGGSLGYVLVICAAVSLLQRCSGRMGIGIPSIFVLGLLQVNSTVSGSIALTVSMNSV